MNDKKLNELSIRFIIPLPLEILTRPELFYFKIEEAHWYYLDFFPKKKKLNLLVFAEKLLVHNNIVFDEDEYKLFIRYKKHLPVYGALILNQSFDKILCVNGFYNNQYFFPKGKKEENETSEQCAMRECYEEVGFNIENKIVGEEIQIGKGFGLFCVVNVSEKTVFKTRTRNEIKEIKWVEIERIQMNKDKCLKQIGSCFEKCMEVIIGLERNRFRFKMDRIYKHIDV